MTGPLEEEFKKIYKEAPHYLFFAPGQVNFMGEQSAEAGCSVLTAAVSQGTWLLAAPNDKNKFVLRTLDLDDYAEILVSPRYRKTNIAWVNYPLGVISTYTQEAPGQLSGLNMLFSGNIPQGVGLSSSASIEMVTSFALDHIFKGGFGKNGLVKMARAAETGFVEESGFIPDQYTVAFGEQETALLLDCANLTHQAVPCKLGEYALLLIDTGRSRAGASRLNDRHLQCRQALTMLQQESPLQSLCDLSPDQLEQLEHLIPDAAVARRARHVVEENARVFRAADALQRNDIEQFGQLMFDSHASLRQLYEITTREQDLVVEASQRKGVAGARMTGAGTGGSVLALVHQAELKNYRNHLVKEYKKIMGYEPRLCRIRTGQGARQLRRT